MKSITTIILLCFSVNSYASERTFKLREVVRVECKSGAPLNPAETIKAGMMVRLQTPESEEEGNAITLEFEITNDGSEYISGKPACPMGDFLVIEFSGR